MKRTVEAEWLDALPAQDPDAQDSRRDLRRLNWLMGHAGVLRDLVESGAGTREPKRIVELGAGDGTLMLRLAKYFSQRWKGVEVVLVDCKDAVSNRTRSEFASLGWIVKSVAADVFDWLEKSDGPVADIMIANLFLHQFSEVQLARLLELTATQANLFAACEPRRAVMALAFSRLLGFIGCNAVTRHDAPLSVLAGFTGQEISSLWPASPEWRLTERPARIFSHAFFAARAGLPTARAL